MFCKLPTVILIWLVLSLGGTSPASADPATRLGPVPQVKFIGRSLLILEERISLNCRGEGTVLTCDSVCELKVKNLKGQPLKVAFELDHRTATLSHQDVSIPPAQLVTVEMPTGISTFRSTIPGAIRYNAGGEDDIFTPALVTRHPLLADIPAKPFIAPVTILSLAKTRRYKGVEQTDVTLLYPGGWSWEGGTEPPPCDELPPAPTGCRRSLPRGDMEVRWRTTAAQGAFAQTIPLSVTGKTAFAGGILLGVSWAGNEDCWLCKEASHVWLGYEIGISTWGILSLMGEYTPTERTTVVMAIEYALPQLGKIPSLAFGLGIPVVMWPEVEPGLRAQISGTWAIAKAFSIGLVIRGDFFPMVRNGFGTIYGAGVQFGI